MAENPGKITLWAVEIFIATADEGSISAAARRVGASASAVSQQLSNLESALGATLLDRSTRPVNLTPAGAMFRRRAHVILNEAAQARAELASSDFSTLTRFRLGVIEDFDADVTPALLSDMASELSHCQFLLETGASHKLFDLLDGRDTPMRRSLCSTPQRLCFSQVFRRGSNKVMRCITRITLPIRRLTPSCPTRSWRFISFY